MVGSRVRAMPGPSPGAARSNLGDSPHTPSEQWTSRFATVGADAELPVPAQMTGEDGSWQQMRLGQQSFDGLPDLRELMYPSMNPFAYGNQPLSILEDAQIMTAERQSPLMEPPTGFAVPASNSGAPTGLLDRLTDLTHQSVPRPATYNDDGHGLTAMCGGNRPSSQNMPSINTQDMAGLGMDRGFWQPTEMIRTTLVPDVNLDELLGSEGGWKPVYMGQGFTRTY